MELLRAVDQAPASSIGLRPIREYDTNLTDV